MYHQDSRSLDPFGGLHSDGSASTGSHSGLVRRVGWGAGRPVIGAHKRSLSVVGSGWSPCLPTRRGGTRSRSPAPVPPGPTAPVVRVKHG